MSHRASPYTDINPGPLFAGTFDSCEADFMTCLIIRIGQRNTVRELAHLASAGTSAAIETLPLAPCEVIMFNP